MAQNKGTHDPASAGAAPDRPEEDVIYCAGCNELFHVGSAPRVCPQCHADVSARTDPKLAETVLYKEPAGQPVVHALPTAAEDDPAASLQGRDLDVYRCLSLLGRGGMGYVYLAQHRDLQRRCALKILSPQAVARDADYARRFLHEGRAAAALIHPNIVTVHAIGQADGFHFLEMEFVPGRSLQHLVYDEGALTPIRATVLAARIAEGLAAAHRSGIIHRDLKPDNVLMTHQGMPKIADFGLAKRVQTEESLPVEYLIGTPNYMAPELLRGEPATPASDVYALGVTYFLMLTGRLPFVAASLRELARRTPQEPLPDIRRIRPEVTLEMAECLSLLLAKAPANRPRDAIEAAQLLHAVSGQVRDIESLLREAFRDASGIIWTRTDSRYELNLTLPDGRHQKLFVEPSDHAPAERLILIYSLCCKADSAHYEEALRLNAEVSHGALAVRKVGGEDYFVMIDTYPRSTVDAEEIRRSVLEVAYRADDLERRLTGADRH